MTNQMPEQISWLQPALNQLATFEPESLNDDNSEAMDVVVAALRQRLRGLSVPDAKKAMQKDLEILAEWLAAPELAESPGHYVYGALFGIAIYGDMREFLS